MGKSKDKKKSKDMEASLTQHEDGSWKHFEFQSTDGGIPDLKRFRVYEAIAS